MCERTRWPAGHFGLAVDKAVLDALLTSRVEHGHAWRASASDLQPARAYLAELHRLLEPGARPHHAKASIRKHMPRKLDPEPCVCVPVLFFLVQMHYAFHARCLLLCDARCPVLACPA